MELDYHVRHLTGNCGDVLGVRGHLVSCICSRLEAFWLHILGNRNTFPARAIPEGR